MFVSFPLSFALFKYFRKACMLLWLSGLLSCKDFKSWESIYGYEVKIKFEPEKEELVPDILKNLQSYKLSKLHFIKKPIITDEDKTVTLYSLSLPLDPNADAVSFELENENNNYHNKVTICYERIVSLIAPGAGGLQIQYTIKDVQLHTKLHKRSIFKRCTIEKFVLLKEEKEKAHVTLYY